MSSESDDQKQQPKGIETNGYLGTEVNELVIIQPARPGPASAEPSSGGLGDKKRAEKKGSPQIVWFEQAFVVYLAAFCVVLLTSMAALSLSDWKSTEYQDFLAYAFPCLAALAAGFGVYLDDWARLLFGASGLLLGLGFAFYLSAHGQTGWLTAIIAVALLVFAGVIAIEALYGLANEQEGLKKYFVFALTIAFYLALGLTSAALLIAAI